MLPKLKEILNGSPVPNWFRGFIYVFLIGWMAATTVWGHKATVEATNINMNHKIDSLSIVMTYKIDNVSSTLNRRTKQINSELDQISRRTGYIARKVE